MDSLRKALPLVLAMGLSTLMASLVFGPLFQDPNAYTYTIGGDGYFIQYHLNYHVRHGSGVELTSMNYPNGELIFMTDAQAGLALALSWINRHILPLEDHIIGISNGLLFYLLPLATLFIWLCLRRLGAGPWFAVPFSVWITFLSPQLSRITCGHYGLGYVFFIPMLIWWALMVYQENNRLRWLWLLLILPVMVFLGLNNPYLLVIGSSFLLAFGIVVWAQSRSWRGWRLGLPYVLTALGPVLLVMGILRSTDPFDDRVMIPWGFFVLLSKLDSLLLPGSGAMYEFLHERFGYEAARFEGRAYLGLVAGLVLLISLIGLIRATVRSRKFGSWFVHNKEDGGLQALTWTGILVFFYAMVIPRLPFMEDFVEQLRFLTQFRAPGRFAWVTYYCFTLLAVMLLWQWHRSRSARRGWFPAALIGLAMAAWGIDAWLFARAQPGDHFENPFPNLEEKFARLDSVLDYNDYQALWLLPTLQGWAKINFPEHFLTEFNGLLLTTHSGLPLLNARLSRISVNEMLEGVELVSDPVIRKTRFENLPDDRPLLILTGTDAPLSDHDRDLLGLSDTVFTASDYTLFRFDPGTDHFEKYRESLFEKYVRNEAGTSSGPLAHEGFNGQRGIWPHTFFGAGAYTPKTGESEIWRGSMPERGRGATAEVSVWVYGDKIHDGGMYFSVRQFNENGVLIKEDGFSATDTRDAQDGWMRPAKQIGIDPNCHSMAVFSAYPFPFLLDELSIRATQDTVVISPSAGTDSVLINNFKLRRPK